MPLFYIICYFHESHESRVHVHPRKIPTQANFLGSGTSFLKVQNIIL